jgi:hypothetical protein
MSPLTQTWPRHATESTLLAVFPEASVAVTVNVNLPCWVESVPETLPAALRVIPGGKALGSGVDQVYGGVPPVAASVAEYALPIWQPGSFVVVTASGAAAGATFNDRVAEAFCPAESVTVTTTDEVPEAVGIPEIAPVEALRVSPAGNPVWDQV